jgi:catechol 2,3-dioxygenase-like lactoylglutathione lyase family enzyme
MTIKRMDHVSVVVDDLPAAIAFFTTLGMALEGETPVEGPWVDRVNGLESVQVDIVMMRTPDGHGRLELTKFRNPRLAEIEPAIAPPNTLGLRSVMFTVESVDDTVARLRASGADSSARWPSTRTSTGSATCEAQRASSSRWPRNSSDA